MENTIKINRQKLYDEIWEISASGVAKQYGLNYAKVIESAKVSPSASSKISSACGFKAFKPRR